jgi:cytochrome c553
MKTQILFVTILAFIIFYDSYLKGPIVQIYTYGKMALAGGTLIFLAYNFYKNPDLFYTALDFAHSHLLHSDGGSLKQINRILEGKAKQNRQVSPLLKKKIAADQKWQCGHCKAILDASYEVDHIVALFQGGSNAENNLVALCRNCHGKKTVHERLGEYTSLPKLFSHVL